MKYFALLAAMIFSLAVHADDNDVFQHPAAAKALLDTVLAEPSGNLAHSQVLQGRFTHRKYLSESPKPLNAAGEFTFARDLGVYWHTQQPFDSVFILTRQGIVQRDEGAETLRLSADEQPAVRVIGNIFLALFTLDLTTLDASFELYGAKQNAKWSIGLKPKSSAVASVFKQAVINGGKEVEQIILTDKHDDRTIIDLQAVTHTADAPSASVHALFNH
ncbi:MAG TPA: outer membrane lipoprotein carrier protein LolA [Steroidobacteraceae bacterium]|nr:outer membrane lipoprotein carrier protein LolA [Steroidobacteraceae bacterium]